MSQIPTAADVRESQEMRIAALEARLAGKEHHHVSGQFCVACGIEEGAVYDRLEEANKRAGEILLRAAMAQKKEAESGVSPVAVYSAAGLLSYARLSSGPLPQTAADMQASFANALKLADPAETLKLQARVEQLVRDAPPAAQVERWKKLEEENARLQRLLSWTQGCVVRAAQALALALKGQGVAGLAEADLAATAYGVSTGLMDVDASITKGEPAVGK